MVGSTVLPSAGSYVAIATIHGRAIPEDDNMLECELRHGTNFIGSAKSGLTEAEMIGVPNDFDEAQFAVTGGAAAAAGDVLSVWCRAVSDWWGVQLDGQNSSEPSRSHMLVLQVGNFF